MSVMLCVPLAEAYSELIQACKMECFFKNSSWLSVFFGKNFTLDVWQSVEYTSDWYSHSASSPLSYTAQKEISIKDFFSKHEQIKK